MSPTEGLYNIKRAFVDFHDLFARGFKREGIIYFSTIAVRFVQDELLICISKGEDISEIQDRIRMVDTIYSECEIAIDHLGHYKLDLKVCFRIPDADSGFVKLVPRMPLLEKLAEEPGVFQIPNGLFAPSKMYMYTEPIARSFKRVLFAGTFDHLHAGHKSVLTQALFHATETLYVGIASESLLTRKKCALALQPFSTRWRKVSEFFECIKPSCLRNIRIELMETPDAIGPAATLDFDAIVVTPETVIGGQMVNEARGELGNKPVEMTTLTILGNCGLEDKVSSTRIRSHLCSQLPGGEEDLKWLHSQWQNLISQLGVPVDVSCVWWSELRDMYGLDPWRFYHNLRHVFDLVHLAQMEAAPPPLLLAILFHDCVYQPQSKTNEDDSILVFRRFVNDISVIPKETGEMVETAIKLTKEHTGALASDLSSLDPWIPIFLELDLAILGSAPERYREYSQAIRKEYQHVPEEIFREKRSELLELWSTFLFRHLSSRDSLNENLLRNLAWELASYQ